MQRRNWARRPFGLPIERLTKLLGVRTSSPWIHRLHLHKQEAESLTTVWLLMMRRQMHFEKYALQRNVRARNLSLYFQGYSYERATLIRWLLPSRLDCTRRMLGFSQERTKNSTSMCIRKRPQSHDSHDYVGGIRWSRPSPNDISLRQC